MMPSPKTRGENSAPTPTVQDAVTETVHRSYGPDGSHVPVKAIAQDMNVAQSVLYDIADEYRPRKLRAEEVPARRPLHARPSRKNAADRTGAGLARLWPSCKLGP